jgi:pentatricopeptide repeat protein
LAVLLQLKRERFAHEQIIQIGWDSNAFVGNCLVDMWEKCGSMEQAWRVFNKMPSRDGVSWNAILGMPYLECMGMERKL